MDGEIAPRFFPAVRPADLEASDRSSCTEPEQHTQIVLGIVAAPAADLLPLHAVGRHQPEPGANGTAVRLCSDEFHTNPSPLADVIQPEEIREIVDVVDDDVEVAIVVEVGEGRAASGLGSRERLTKSFGHVGEPSITKVVIHDLSLLIAG